MSEIKISENLTMPLNAATKKCNQCKLTKATLDFYKASTASRSKFMYACKNCVKRQTNLHYKKVFAENPILIRKRKQLWQEMNREVQRKSSLKHREKIRHLVLIHYGGTPPKCKCCGETEIKFLSLDHKKGNGKRHRIETKGHVYSDIIKKLYPDDYQVLCHNCNLAKGFYGRCPHERT